MPNLTGFSVRACATRQIFANSSGTPGADLVVDRVVLPAADDLVQPRADRVAPRRTSSRCRTPTCPPKRSDGYENHERPAEVGVEVVVAVREDVEPGELLVARARSRPRRRTARGRRRPPSPSENGRSCRLPREPRRPWPGARDGRWQDEVFRCGQHVSSFCVEAGSDCRGEAAGGRRSACRRRPRSLRPARRRSSTAGAATTSRTRSSRRDRARSARSRPARRAGRRSRSRTPCRRGGSASPRGTTRCRRRR